MAGQHAGGSYIGQSGAADTLPFCLDGGVAVQFKNLIKEGVYLLAFGGVRA